MNYYLIAGEASGDLHGSNLIKEIKKQDRQACFRAWGGDLMEAQGVQLVKHYRDLAFMGFLEVALNLRTILANISFCERDIEAFQPDVVVFIDYPGFNLRIAKWAKQKGYHTHYYISPQVWAWKENRVKQIMRDIDQMYVILPFEKSFYEDKHGYPVHYVGHPLLDAIEQHEPVNSIKFKETLGVDPHLPIIALLPGSRKQEIRKMLDIMLSVIPYFEKHQFVIAGAPGVNEGFYDQFLTNPNVYFVSNRTYDLLTISDAALVTSGTATLETALFNVPEVVCYKGNWVSYQIAKRVINLDFISLVNLIMEKEVVKELIQDELTTKNLQRELELILNSERRKQIYEAYSKLKEKLGGGGASKRVADRIIRALRA